MHCTTWGIRLHHALIDLHVYALTVKPVPDFAILALNTNIPEKATVTPQKACRPVQPSFNIAPAIGLPRRRPIAIGTKSMPIRTPRTFKDGESVTVTVGGSETKVPEKKLPDY